MAEITFLKGRADLLSKKMLLLLHVEVFLGINDIRKELEIRGEKSMSIETLSLP